MRDNSPVKGARPAHVLALDTEWFSVHGGMTTFNRQLCTALAAAGARVFCVVLSATPDQIADAAGAGVTLIQARETPGGSGRDTLMRRVELPGGLEPDLVIGHGRITGPAARALVEDHYTGAARLHVVHTSPDETEWAKAEEAEPVGERAEDRVRVEKEIAQGATGVAAVGPRLHGQLLRDLSAMVDPPVALRLDPGFDTRDIRDRTPPPGGPKQILILGRLEDRSLKGLDIAAKAIAHAVERHDVDDSDVEILLRGAPVGQQAALRGAFAAWTGRTSLRISTRSYSADVHDLQEDLRRATLVLMPSRAEGFGLAGAEAIVSGAPVLVSDRSGLGMLLQEALPHEDAARIVVPVRGDESDVRFWGAAIAAVLNDAGAAFARASRVRRVLAEQRTWSSAAAEVLRLCSSRTGATPIDGVRRHWLASVQVSLPDGRVECLFTGRGRAIERIVGWIHEREDQPVCVVTGDPGSGKSAVLAWFALGGADPQVGERLYDEAAYPRHPGRVIRAVVHAKGLRLQGIVDAIAAQLGVACADADELDAVLAAMSEPAVVVIDAVDESPDAAGVITQIIQPIIRRRHTTPVAFLLGMRPHLARRLREGVEVVDLDGRGEEDFADPGALVDYAYRILAASADTGGSTLLASPERARRVATALARSAESSFLVARLSALAIVERGELPWPDRPFPKTVAAAMDGYLDALPLDRTQAEDLLRPLAFARGLGLPSGLWVRLAGELAGVPGRYTMSHLADLFTGPLASLITSTRQAGAGRALYRLFHQALDENMAAVPAAFPDAPRPGPEMRETVAHALLTSARSDAGTPEWSDADPYVRAHLLSHAAGTSVMPLLTRDAMFLVAAGRGNIIRALPDISAVDMGVASAYESVVQHQDAGTPVVERMAYLALGALRLGDPALVRDWRPAPEVRRRAPWWPVRARWRPIAGHQVVRVHAGAVNQVEVARVFEEKLVVSGSDDATLAITSLPEPGADDGGRRTRIADTDGTVRFEHAVRALAIADVDRLPLVVAGTADGRVHVIDLPGGTELTRPTQPAGSPVSALTAVQHESGWMAVAGHEDGNLRFWRILPLSPFAPATSIDGTEIHRIVRSEPGALLLVTGSGILWQWEIDTGRVSQRSTAGPRVTALAAMPGGDRDIIAVTGHDDGSVRLWPAAPLPPVATVQVPGSPLISTIAAVRVGARRLVLLAGEDDDVRVVDVASREVWPLTLSGHGEPLWHLTTTDLGGRPMALGASEDDTVHLWHLGGLDAARPDDDFVAERWSVSRLVADGSRLLATAGNEAARFAVIDALTGDREAGPFEPPEPEALSTTALRVVEGEVWYAAATENGTLGIGTVPGPPVWSNAERPDWVVHAGFLVLDGLPILVTVTSEGLVSVRDELATRPHHHRDLLLEGPAPAVTAASVARDPEGVAVLLIGDRSGRAGVWRLSDLALLAPMRQIAPDALRSLTLSPVGGGVVAGTHSGLLRVETPRGLVTRSAHRRSVTCTLATEELIISGGEDGVVNAWRHTRLDDPPVTIDVGAPIGDLHLMRDGTLAIGSHHGTVIIELPG